MPANKPPPGWPKAAHYRERHAAPQPTVFTAKTPLSRLQPVC
jgi:hypothetical protein